LATRMPVAGLPRRQRGGPGCPLTRAAGPNLGACHGGPSMSRRFFPAFKLPWPTRLIGPTPRSACQSRTHGAAIRERTFLSGARWHLPWNQPRRWHFRFMQSPPVPGGWYEPACGSLKGASHPAVTFPPAASDSESATWCVEALSHCDWHPTFNIRASALARGPRSHWQPPGPSIVAGPIMKLGRSLVWFHASASDGSRGLSRLRIIR
jgi:hypothetical protein